MAGFEIDINAFGIIKFCYFCDKWKMKHFCVKISFFFPKPNRVCGQNIRNVYSLYSTDIIYLSRSETASVRLLVIVRNINLNTGNCTFGNNVNCSDSF